MNFTNLLVQLRVSNQFAKNKIKAASGGSASLYTLVILLFTTCVGLIISGIILLAVVTNKDPNTILNVSGLTIAAIIYLVLGIVFWLTAHIISRKVSGKHHTLYVAMLDVLNCSLFLIISIFGGIILPVITVTVL